MTFNPHLHKSIFVGDWGISRKGEREVLLSRKVQVNGKFYLMTVGYNEGFIKNLDDPTQAELVIQKVIEKSETQIEKFIKAHTVKSNKPFSISLKTDIIKRTGAVARSNLGSPHKEDYKSLDDLKVTNKKEYDVTSNLIQSISQEYMKILSLSPQARLVYLKPAPDLIIEFEEQTDHGRVDTKGLGALKAQKALHLIEELKGLADEGPVLHNGKKYNVPAEDKYGRRKWMLEIDGVSYEINEYKDRAYNGVTTEDFIKRQELVLFAAMQYIESKHLRKEAALRKAIVSLDLEFQKDMQKKDYQVDWKSIKSGEDITEQYKEINQRATERIAQFAKDVQHVINTALGEEGNFSIDDLDLCEREVVHKRDRPVIINTYIHSGRKFLNMHAPEAKEFESKDVAVPRKTIPSTIRSCVGLPNYLTTYGGVIRSDGTVVMTYEAVRHSSYPPIQVKSTTLRQALAAENVKQGLRDLAYKSLLVKPRETSKDDPLVIPLRTMMLFTPKKGDFLRNRKNFVFGRWTGESEVLQMMESILVLRMFHGRTIPLKLGSDTVWVKPDISMMNLGANPEAAGIGLFGKLPTNGFQSKVNARGFVDFVTEIESVFQSAELPKSIRALMREIEQLEKSHEKYLQAHQQVTNIVTEKEFELRILYSDLENLYAEYASTKKTSLKPQIASILLKIKSRENAIYKAHSRLVKIMKKSYLENQTAIAEKEQALFYLFNKHMNLAETGEEQARLQKLRDIRQNLQLAKTVFYGGGCEKAETLMEFQSVYIQTHSMLNNFVEMFCKSGEDRTGRVDDKVQEREVFLETQYKVPVSPSDYKIISEIIALIVHQYSVSQNTTEHNSNARGEQISFKVNPSVPAEHDRLQATMAKRVITEAKNLSPSAEAVHTVGRYKLHTVAVCG